MSKRLWLCVLAIVTASAAGPVAIAAPGDVDSQFGSGGQSAALPATAGRLHAMSDGSIVVEQWTREGTGFRRVKANGALDASFGTSGLLAPAGCEVLTHAQQGDALIVVCSGGSAAPTKLIVRRLRLDGTWDASFGVSGQTQIEAPVAAAGRRIAVIDVALDGTMKLLIQTRVPTATVPAGWLPGTLAVALDADGSPDNSFGTNGRAFVDWVFAPAGAIVVLPSGRIVMMMVTNFGNPKLYAMSSTGARELSFGEDGVLQMPAPYVGLASDASGRLYVGYGGDDHEWLGGAGTRMFVTRYTQDGVPDATFGVAGTASIAAVGIGTAYLDSLLVEPSGAVFIAGFRQRFVTWTGSPAGSYHAITVDDFFAARLSPYGVPDGSFSGDGLAVIDGVPRAGSSVRQANGRIVIGSAVAQAGDVSSLFRFCGDDTTCAGSDPSTLRRGSNSGDLLLGTFASDSVSGGNGSDRIIGRAGSDKLRGDAGNDRLVGDAGSDTMNGGGGRDVLNGGAAGDTLHGGGGNDALNGGAGRDLMVGGVGHDVVFARDARRDTIRCGPGRDRVLADRIDVVSRDCEVVQRTA